MKGVIRRLPEAMAEVAVVAVRARTVAPETRSRMTTQLSRIVQGVLQ